MNDSGSLQQSYTFLYRGPSIGDLPSSPSEFVEWQRDLAATTALLGPASWTVQTYLWMRSLGLNCSLVSEFPERGLVLAHRDDLPNQFVVRSDRFVICMLADRKWPHPFAQFHVTQNPRQRLTLGQPFSYIPHWPQSGLIPRNHGRSSHVQNVKFYGEPVNMAPELADVSFSSWCSAHGFHFECVPRDSWNDFSDCDVVIAVRSFDRSFLANDKPATKLFNSWLAGVPAILGPESAYRYEGCAGRDYIEAVDLESLKLSLLRLKANAAEYLAMVNATRERALARDHTSIAQIWRELLSNVVLTLAERHARKKHLEIQFMMHFAFLKERLAWRGYLTRQA